MSANIISETLIDYVSDAYKRLYGAGLQTIDECKNKVSYVYGGNAEHSGLVIGSERNKNGELVIHKTAGLTHTLVCSSTGLGKTQGFILNNLFCANPNQSYVIADVKGELLEQTYYHFCETHGEQNVHIFNFRQPKNSTCYFNPFAEVAEKMLQAEKASSSVVKSRIRSEALTDLSKLINTFFVVTDSKEPSWQESAKMLIEGIFLGLIEDAVLGKIETREVTLGAVINVFSNFVWDADDWGDNGFFSKRSKYSLARRKAQTILSTTAKGTRTSYLSLVSLYLQAYNQPKILEIMRRNNFDFSFFQERPQVVFVVYDLTNDSTKEIVNVFFENMLTKLCGIYNKSLRPLNYPVLFFLDEFDSLKPKTIYPNLLSTGRGMGIFLQIVVQSLAQIKSSYGEKWSVITENCNLKIFLGTNNYETARDFSNECGETVVLSKNYLRRGEFFEEKENVVSVEKILFQMQRGGALVKMIHMPAMSSLFAFAYKTPEYNQTTKFNPLSIMNEEIKVEEEIGGGIEVEMDSAQVKKAREALELRKREILKRLEQQVKDE